MLLLSPIPTFPLGQITQEVKGCFCYAINKEGYFCFLHDNRKWSSIREFSCPCNGNINAVSSHEMTELKDPRVLLLCLKLAFEGKWMACSAGTYLDSLSDFWAGAKLLFSPCASVKYKQSLILLFLHGWHLKDALERSFLGKEKERLSRQISELQPAVEIGSALWLKLGVTASTWFLLLGLFVLPEESWWLKIHCLFGTTN